MKICLIFFIFISLFNISRGRLDGLEYRVLEQYKCKQEEKGGKKKGHLSWAQDWSETEIDVERRQEKEDSSLPQAFSQSTDVF